MEIYRDVEVPATTTKKLEAVVCDLCGQRGEGGDWPRTSGNDDQETEIYLKVGWSCPDGGSYEVTTLDMCPDCFRDRLVPWLNSQGAKVRTEDRDW